MLDSQMIPTKKAAKFLGISEDHLYKVREGNLKWAKKEGKTFYHKSSLEKLLAKREKERLN